MKNPFPGMLICCMMACSFANAQYPDELTQADSLIQVKEYQKAVNLLNHLIDQKPTRFVLSKAYFQLGLGYLGLEDFSKAKYYNEQSLSIKEDLLYELIADNYMLFGLIDMQIGNDDSALKYLFKATELPYETPESGGLIYAYIALIYYQNGDLENMVKYYKIAMETWQTAFEESGKLDKDHYQIRRNRLFYDNFFVGFL